ncbi:ATP-binding protein [Stenotrophomonas acidaminiphila]|uniref:hybrid sensor histidine kinase/response regulator n=1 Tax=Stenotrophomonas acidaminiphila TaxID=128780 RepID=UPI0028AE5D73|nr:ATP-binding protein [Stenotrophomonas acidaminiphila]
MLAVAAGAAQWLPPPLPAHAVSTVLAGLACLCALLAALAARALAETSAAFARRARDNERELQRLRQEQQRHVQLEQQLLQAKQDAEAAMLAKGEFLATMSHEIRTPLNGIIPMLEMVAQGPLGAEQREMLNTASESSRALFRIVDDILDYSKLEAQRLELEITTFNLRELLDSLLQLMRRSAAHKGLDITLALDPAVRLAVRGDPVRLRQVLSNLMVNAIKFTERGGIQVQVRRMGETNAQHLLRFEVRDTGIGIDADQQQRLFSAFTQADASTTRLYGGTGLGLAICKRIIDLMHGKIGLDSVPGQGSTFWFEIPLLKVLGDLRAPAHAAHPRVLLVSTDARLRQRLELVLPNWGFDVRSVDTVQEALDLLRAGGMPQPWHAVIGDLPSLRLGVAALQRASGEHRLVWLQGDAPLPAELHDSARVIAREAADAALRTALSEPATRAPLPLQQTPATAAEAPHADVPPPARAGGLAGARVLLVEDNPVNLLVAQKLLGVLGCEVDTAINGQLALDKLHATPYQAVLMDCQMPVLDGYAATRRWREHEAATQAARLPIIAMTANAMVGDRQRCLDAGMDDYLSKPISREGLQACLLRWCGATAAADEAPPQAAPAQLEEAPASAVQATALPVLDREVLDELREIAGAETATIIDVFLDDTTPLVRQLQEAAVAPDLEQLRELAHSLKSASANVGALALSAAARRVELAARAGKLERPAVMVALIIAEFARARLALIGYQSDMRGERAVQA